MILIVFLVSILVNRSGSECLCTQKDAEVTCNENARNQDTSIAIDQILRTKTSLPFRNVNILRLQCNLKTLYASWFVDQNSLHDLDLSMNKISRIPNDFFESLSQLQYLNMSRNMLRNPAISTFNAVSNLKVLDISYNRITNLERQILDKNPQLQQLYVSHNGLFELPPETFEDTTNIKEIDMSDNHIRSIDARLFKYNPEVESLNFAKNDINGNLELMTFNYTRKLKYLNLSNTNINLIPEQFANNGEIITLDLSKNALHSLPENIFHPLVNLEKLYLAYCQLLKVVSNLLHQNYKLNHLDLSHNNLRHFPSQFFDAAQNLKSLNISKNLFRSIPGNIIEKTTLITLDISHNLLSDIVPELLKLPTLENVYLQNNKLMQLNLLSASTYPLPIKYLNLEFNQLVFLKPNFFNVLINLKEINILNNPWNCKCFDELLETLTKKNITYQVGDYREGNLPLCVLSDTCNYDETNLNYYYDVYRRHFS